MFCALERPRVAVDLAPGIRSTGAVARGNALAIASTDIGRASRDRPDIRRYSRVAVVLWLGLFGYLGGGILCDVHCEAELADNADFALAGGVVVSAEPSD
jgi:hypothetical protein